MLKSDHNVFLPGQRRWCGTGRPAAGRGTWTASARRGAWATRRWPAWRRLCRAAACSSRPPAAAPAPTWCCASRTATPATPGDRHTHTHTLVESQSHACVHAVHCTWCSVNILSRVISVCSLAPPIWCYTGSFHVLNPSYAQVTNSNTPSGSHL